MFDPSALKLTCPFSDLMSTSPKKLKESSANQQRTDEATAAELKKLKSVLEQKLQSGPKPSTALEAADTVWDTVSTLIGRTVKEKEMVSRSVVRLVREGAV